MALAGSRTGPVQAERTANLPDVSAGNGFSMMGWFYRRSSETHTDFESLLSLNGGGDYLTIYEFTSSADLRVYADTGGNFSSGWNIPNDTWFFVGVTQAGAGSDTSLWRRTESEFTLTETNSATVQHGGATETTFDVCNAHFGNEAAQYFVCGVKLFDRELTPNEMLMESFQHLPRAQNCIGCYPMLADTLIDPAQDLMGQADLDWIGGTPTLTTDHPNIAWGAPAPGIAVGTQGAAGSVAPAAIHNYLRNFA